MTTKYQTLDKIYLVLKLSGSGDIEEFTDIDQ